MLNVLLAILVLVTTAANVPQTVQAAETSQLSALNLETHLSPALVPFFYLRKIGPGVASLS